MKKIFILHICVFIIFMNCSGKLKSENENKKKITNGASGERKISKYNYGSLKKKFNIENKEEKENQSIMEHISDNVSQNSEEEEELKNKNGGSYNSHPNDEHPYDEYTKCINTIEKEFKDKENSEYLKMKEELEKLCLKKKAEDEEKKKEEEKRKLQRDMQNNATEKEKQNREIISQLGLSSKLVISNEILSESLSEVKNCLRNYREKCPLNWELSKDNTDYCTAPESYIGPCGKQIHNDVDISEKMRIEKKCFVFWKCDNNCIQDFENSTCPLDWVIMDEEYCIAPDNYVGNCLNKINFLNMSNKEKSIYSNLCDIKWPCKEKCEHDYSVLCPDRWIEGNNGYCFPTNSYNGNCKGKIYLKHLNKIMKQTYEQKCQFSYPCINSCEKNYDDLCPNSWLSINENECAPSEYYNGNCKENYIFKNKNQEEKKLFEKLCDVSYSCIKKCKRDYSFNCPIGWKETLSFCLAPISYKHSCNKMMKKNMNVQEKTEISKKCNVFWPCSNYEILLKNLINSNISEEDYLSVVNGPVDNVTGSVIYV
ncbi:CPW-WPC family protein, putative [Plasmodium malariae]|uniref:CPW-WPC family protein, putative n=2 Tax=Plasmodium malariae TaxID=5858 RepID=A0A1D3PAZ2_PLAMA|nr:CPW-WPC family protein, putative [Plasmodium malariae]SCN12234.1 CPW-WPC family protein, putative [Plasmodium malariae]